MKNEKQILDPETIAQTESSLEAYFSKKRNEQSIVEDDAFTIQITEKCNMNCTYCYQQRFTEKDRTMKKEQIDNIKKFQEALCKKYELPERKQTINITGGEPLLNDDTVELVNYIANIWPDAKLSIMTNGINLIKYKELLPLNNIDEFLISLDGNEGMYAANSQSMIFNNMIIGLKWLLSNDKKISVNTVFMPETVRKFPDFLKLLRNLFLSRKNLILEHP